jgi:GrpB-like predicted nucleotidyltransferase (UPF0157 family)
MHTIVVSDYDPRWPEFFAQIHDRLLPAVRDLAESIEHVGSTAVPGLAAKPIIDVDIVIPSAELLPEIVARVEPLGYSHLGDLGIPGRDAFRQHNDLPRHNLYVCPRGSIGLRNHLALRDYLRAHPEAVAAYGALKRGLAEKFPADIARYVDGKTGLIASLLRAADLPPEDVARIEGANRLP